MPVQQVAPVVCSTCNTRFTAPVQNIINGQDSAMKVAFLQGRINVIQCPQCGSATSPTMPVLYYDLEKELALIFAPVDLSLGGSDQEKVIGQLTNSLVDSLKPEQRKFYLLSPKRFLSLESLAKAVLEADGVTEEMMQAQASRAALLQEFLQTADENELKAKVQAHDAELDYEFFEMLTAYMQSAQREGEQARAQTFFSLRTVLARFSSNGKAHLAAIDAKYGVVVIADQDDLLEKLKNAKDEQELGSLIASGHAMLDYSFFQKLTADIDQATKRGDSKEAEALRMLRTTVLDLKAKQEKESRNALEKASNLLKEILQAGRPDTILQEKLDEIDEAFFYVLQMNIEEAQRQGQDQPAQALQMIGNMALGMLQEQHAPEKPETKPKQPESEQSQILTAKR